MFADMLIARSKRVLVSALTRRQQKDMTSYGMARLTVQGQALLARVAFIFALVLFVAYWLDLGLTREGRLLSGIAPLTLMLEMLMGVGLIAHGFFEIGKGWHQGAFVIVFLLSLARLGEYMLMSDAPLSHIAAWVMSKTPESQNQMAANTALSLLFMSASGLIRRRNGGVGLLLAAVGFFPITVATLGYSYNHPFVYGAMRPATLVILAMLGLSLLFSYSRSRFLRPFLTSSRWGRVVRLQAVVTVTGIWLAGAVVHQVNDSGVFELGLAGSMWVVLIVTLASGPLFERIERDRRRLVNEMEKRARLDPLTGVWNRHGVRDYLSKLDDVARRNHKCGEGLRLGVILADVDHFKQVNDHCGHEAGDRVLCQIAEALRGKLRSTDVVARWGGEEFLILLPGANEQQTYQVAQQLRVGVASQVAWIKEGRRETITMSIGVAEYESAEVGLSVDAVIQRADTALYQAKEQGRNRVKCYSGEEEGR